LPDQLLTASICSYREVIWFLSRQNSSIASIRDGTVHSLQGRHTYYPAALPKHRISGLPRVYLNLITGSNYCVNQNFLKSTYKLFN